MILKGILDLLKAFLLFIIGLFPTLPDMSWLIGTISPVVQVFASLNMVVDVGVLSLCIGLLFLFSNIEFVWGIIMWVVRKIPGVS